MPCRSTSGRHSRADHNICFIILALLISSKSDECCHFGSCLKFIIADKSGCQGCVELLVDIIASHVVCSFAGTSRCLSLNLHCLMETILIDGESLVIKDLLCQVDRESVGIIKLKCVLTCKDLCSLCFHLFFKIRQNLKTFVDGSS